MEKFIQKAGKALAHARIAIDRFLKQRIGGSRTNLILFILALFVFLILVVSAVLNFKSLLEHYKIYLALLFLMVLALLWAAIFYESQTHLESDNHDFELETLKKSKMKYHLLDLDERSQKEFDRFLSGKNVRKKINFTMGNKSGDSANHRILFVLFDELIIGGIKDLSGERKESFFRLLMDSFIMNGQPINQNTLKTSFSTWKSEQEKVNSRKSHLKAVNVLPMFYPFLPSFMYLCVKSSTHGLGKNSTCQAQTTKRWHSSCCRSRDKKSQTKLYFHG